MPWARLSQWWDSSTYNFHFSRQHQDFLREASVEEGRMGWPCLPYLFLLFTFYAFSLFWDRVSHVTQLSSDSLHELLILLPLSSECGITVTHGHV